MRVACTGEEEESRTDAEKSVAEKEDATGNVEVPDADDSGADTRAALASISPSLNISVPPLGTRIASARPCTGTRIPREQK